MSTTPAAGAESAPANGAGGPPADSAPVAAPEDGAGEAFARPQRGDELELSIDSLAFGGEGVARLGEGGYVVFVAGAIPGDRVRALVHKRKRSYAHARTLEVLEPSPQRIAPLADHPGVAWQVMPYELQLQVKSRQVHEALTRLGGLGGFELEEIVPALEQWRYRNKLEYSFGGGGEEELVCGFHAPAGGNRVLAMEDCLLASEEGNRARSAALAWCRAQGLSAWERRPGEGPRQAREQRTGPSSDGRARLRNLVVREGRRTGMLQVRIVSTEGELEAGELAAALSAALGKRLSGVLWTRTRSLAETTAGGETELVWGDGELPERLGAPQPDVPASGESGAELDLRISAEAFFQTNTEMAELLYEQVVRYAALEGWERVYDLYSGIGTIALTMAPRAGELWGIELLERAVADAIAAAKRNSITNAHFFAGDTRTALGELVERAGRPDVIVVDPPRAGLSKKVVRRIVEASPRRIVYVSCNPTTLAPNAAELVEAGWSLKRVRPVDMFPQTHHIECVAVLERDDGRRTSASSVARVQSTPRSLRP